MVSNKLIALMYSTPLGHLQPDIMAVITFVAVKSNGELLDLAFLAL